jgi:hypothetical protein
VAPSSQMYSACRTAVITAYSFCSRLSGWWIVPLAIRPRPVIAGAGVRLIGLRHRRNHRVPAPPVARAVSPMMSPIPRSACNESGRPARRSQTRTAPREGEQLAEHGDRKDAPKKRPGQQRRDRGQRRQEQKYCDKDQALPEEDRYVPDQRSGSRNQDHLESLGRLSRRRVAALVIARGLQWDPRSYHQVFPSMTGITCCGSWLNPRNGRTPRLGCRGRLQGR